MSESQFFYLIFFFTKWWSLLVEGLLSTGPTPSWDIVWKRPRWLGYWDSWDSWDQQINRPLEAQSGWFWLLELVNMFLDSYHWDEWQTFENQCSLDFEQQNEGYNEKSMSHSFSSTCVQNISSYGMSLLSKPWI